MRASFYHVSVLQRCHVQLDAPNLQEFNNTMLSLEEHRVATRMDCTASYIDNECEDNRILLT